MSFFRKKPDPITERNKALNQRIAQLEAEIKQLNNTNPPDSPPRPRPIPQPPATTSSTQPSRPPAAPLFIEAARKPAVPSMEAIPQPQLYNDLGVRKYNLAEAIRRLFSHFRGPEPSNPKFVSYLAAGNIQGLRPLRYEKRVARNRFIALVIVFTLALWGILAVIMGRH
ncbi:MAG: hypothetical protein WCO56_19815 [Verrucomicrobiota bacterium]